MKWVMRICCIWIALCLFLILLINAIDYAVYYRPDFYRETFEKYNVTENAKMEMSEVLKVSDNLINYLKDNEDSLEKFQAIVNGEERKFYSEREIRHMADVKVLFGYGIALRKICLGICLFLLIFMLIGKLRFYRTLVRYIVGTFLTLIGMLGILVVVVSQNFSRAFTVFHQLFFNNDLWLLDPDVDWVIRLLPEGFFKDIACVIFIVFSLSLLATLVACFIYLRVSKTHFSDNRSDAA